MGSKFARGTNALGLCDVCGFRYKLSELRNTTVKGKQTSVKACPECYDPDHPQLMVGMYPVFDPQALRDPRSDHAELAASRALITPLHSLPMTGFIGRVTVTN